MLPNLYLLLILDLLPLNLYLFLILFYFDMLSFPFSNLIHLFILVLRYFTLIFKDLQDLFRIRNLLSSFRSYGGICSNLYDNLGLFGRFWWLTARGWAWSHSEISSDLLMGGGLGGRMRRLRWLSWCITTLLQWISLSYSLVILLDVWGVWFVALYNIYNFFKGRTAIVF